MSLIQSKQEFFKSAELKAVDFPLPNGQIMRLHELTAGDRSKLFEAVNDKIIHRQALTVVLASDLLDESDLDSVLQMPGDLVRKMSDKVLQISGMGEESAESAEKN